MTMTKAMGYVDDVDFRADLNLRLDDKKSDEILTEGLNNGNQTSIYEDIHFNLNETDAETGAYILDDAAALALLTKLVEIQLNAMTDPEFGADKTTLHDLGGLLGSILTEEEIEELYRQAIQDTDLTDDPFQDSDPRDFTVEIGQRTEYTDTTIYNDGSIIITQADSDFTASTIKSEREDVTIIVEKGSIWADNETDMHIYGDQVTLNVYDSIGTEDQPLVLEQSANRPVLVPGIIETPYFDGANPTDPDDQSYIDKILAFEAGLITFPEFLKELTEKDYILRLVEVEVEDGDTGEDTGDDETERKPVYEWILDVLVRHDWIREDYPEEATRLDAIAQTGSIYLKENSGDIGIGNVTADDNVTITAPGSILDVRNDDEIAAGETNISATNANLTAQTGTIGTEEKPILVQLTGTDNHLYADGDVDVDALGSLTAEIDSVNGKLDISAEDDLTITNTERSAGGTGDMILDNLLAGGNVTVTATGNILGQSEESSDKDIEAGSDVKLTAGENIGSKDDTLRVDSAQSGDGTVSAFGKDITIQETDGDLTIEKVTGTGDVKLDAPDGKLTDTTDSMLDDVAEAQREADTLKNLATTAQAAADSKQLVADAYEDAANEAKERLEELAEIPAQMLELQDQLQDTTLTDKQRKDLEKQLKELDKRRQELLENENDYHDAIDAYEKAQAEADAAQAVADEAAKRAEDAQKAVAQVAEEKKAELEERLANAETEEEKAEILEALEWINNLLEQMEAIHDKAEDLQQKADAAQAEAERLKDAADAMEQEATEAADALEELEDLPGMIEDVEHLLADPDLKEEDRVELENQLDELNDRLTELEAAKEDLEQTVSDYEDAVDAYEEAQEKADQAALEANAAKDQTDHLDQTSDPAASEQIEADHYQQAADEAKAEAEAKQEYADSLKPGAEEAAQKIPEVVDQLADTRDQIDELKDQMNDPNLTDRQREKIYDRITDLREKAKELEETLEQLNQTVRDAEDAQIEADKAAAKAEDIQSQADAQQAQAEEVKKEQLPIYAGGDLDITAKDSIGSDEDPLDITAGGEVNAESQSDVNLGNSAHMNLGQVNGEDVKLGTSGDIRPTDDNSGINTGVKDDPDTEEDESQTQTGAEVNALGSSAGTDDKPLNVDADRISGTIGDNANIHTPDSIIVDQLTAQGDLKLDSDGDILAGDADEGAANVTGGSLDLNADGNIGSEEKPLVGDLRPEDGNNKGLSADAEDIYLKLLGDVVIRDVDGDDVTIDAGGRVDGADDNGYREDINADNLVLNGTNGVGTKDNPLIIVVPGKSEITSQYGEIWAWNLAHICCCRCTFWDMVEERILEAEEGEVVEIEEICTCDHMPEKIMRALRERDDVTLILHVENEETLIIEDLVIEAGEALEYEPGTICYEIEWLIEYYMKDKT